VHRPGHNHFPFSFQISLQSGPSHTFRGDAAHGTGPYALYFPSSDDVIAESGSHISRTNRENAYPVLLQFQVRRFSNRIQRKLSGAVGGMKKGYSKFQNVPNIFVLFLQN